MCIIRQLMNQHSIIDSFPRVLVEFDSDALEKARASAPPDLCVASVSSGSSNISGVSTDGLVMNGGKQKIAQDVNVFKGIAARMPPKALFHLLRGAASASEEERSLREDSDSKVAGKESRHNQRRRVRFAPERNNAVYEIPKITDPSLWWQREDFNAIRRNAGTVAEEYRRYHREYSQSIVRLLGYYEKRLSGGTVPTDLSHDSSQASALKQDVIRAFMQVLAENEITRGLELHIIREYDRNNRDHVNAVLAAASRALYDTHAVRRACLRNSRISCRMAYRFARYDTKQALYCILTPWQGPWCASGGGRPPLKPTRSSDPLPLPMPMAVD